MSEWFLAGPQALLWIVVSTIGMYILIILCARFSGVRSFAEMSTFDIVVSVAIGSMVASVVVSKNPPLLQGAAAVITLYALQLAISHVRSIRRTAEKVIDNRPILLMGEGGMIRHGGLRVARVTEDDLRTHLRAANVSDPRAVRAVIMEGTGTINVLHGEHHALTDGAWILHGVRDYGED
ncbi:DUF421 domain-containing protein [Salinisphaera sp. Q1T1-3]|uniref:DUF421 domain-containing protein n=1 Tax=Salinisphaera sp. Q1T1-3 TaxID=2321229 RepID=UPI000E74777F|nr:YetF domain-containing protein [Salinisphaera sp. Q1T1-3]RJS92843.1 DUF421 domain-containing protein [Salinisphaera sp. Q1T1-3]